MSIGLRYPDKIKMFEVDTKLYGQEFIVQEAIVPAIFEQNTGWSHANGQDAVTASVTVFVDPTNAFVRGHVNRLEGMLVVAQFSGVGEADAWYRVTDVAIARDSLLFNRIDNIQLALKKTTGVRQIS
jgi:hypothetical protein